MMIVGKPGSYDLEAMATGRPVYVAGTMWTLYLLATCWTLLFLTTIGIKQDTWYCVAVGAIGFVANAITAALPCKPEELGMNLEPYQPCPSIIGQQRSHESKRALKNSQFDMRELQKVDPENDVRDVMGALMELEKHFEKAGEALLPVFFPGGTVSFENCSLTQREKEFWQQVGRPQSLV